MGRFEEEHTRKNPVNLVVENPLEEKVINNSQHNNEEFPRSEMNRLDDNIPILKVRHLK